MEGSSRVCPSCGTANDAAARFCSNCGNRLSATEPPTASTRASEPAPPEREVERKVITALFCDVVGSTELAERLDPEDVDRLMSAYHGRARTVIEAHGGVVEKFIGDAVVGIFGAPATHEDDPARAVRAAPAASYAGSSHPVMWRPGFTGRRVGSEVVVVDPNGNLVATTGQSYRIAGNFLYQTPDGVVGIFKRGYVPSPIGVDMFYACDVVRPKATGQLLPA